MTYCAVADGYSGPASQQTFLEEQRRHDCTDCGYSYLTPETVVEGEHFRRVTVGGGTVVTSKHDRITEVHILPHGGTELPQDFLDELEDGQFADLARLVHANSDTGTGAMYRALVEDVVAGRARGIAVAGFHLSRLLLDANRVKIEEQVPARPYVGSADLYAHYLRERGLELRERALLPWIDAVNNLLVEVREGEGVVYHHHTYDVQSFTPRPWDQGPETGRPAFQLVWRKPAWETQFRGDHPDSVEGLAPYEDMERLRKRISVFLQDNIGLEQGEGAIDYPLLLPVSPFTGTRTGDPPGTPHHVMYDLRKDILVNEQQIQSWVTVGPWRLDSGPRPAERVTV